MFKLRTTDVSQKVKDRAEVIRLSAYEWQAEIDLKYLDESGFCLFSTQILLRNVACFPKGIQIEFE
jgi:hypothetical protein